MNRLTLSIEQLNSSGAGVARHEGKVYFVPFTAPGDEVEVEVNREHKRFSEARVLRILAASPKRTEPLCAYFFKCGGCQLQHLHYDAQLAMKKNLVENALGRIGRFENIPVADTVPSPQIWNYRNRIRLHRDEKNRLGFYGAGSHQVVEIEACLIAKEEINRVLTSLRKGKIKFPADGEIRTDGGKAFGQVNEAQNKNLVKQVMDFANLTGSEIVVDVYAGSGNFTLPLAQKAAEVIAIEGDRSSVDWGIQKSKEAGYSIRWMESSAATGLMKLAREKIKPAVLVCDPPRQGMKEALEVLADLNPPKIIYVSCDPATFARDAAFLAQKGWTLKQVVPLDMFPQTVHVEVVGMLTKPSAQ